MCRIGYMGYTFTKLTQTNFCHFKLLQDLLGQVSGSMPWMSTLSDVSQGARVVRRIVSGTDILTPSIMVGARKYPLYLGNICCKYIHVINQ